MEPTPPIQEVRSSRWVQGCLFGAVGLFVILLASMLLLAYLRFREATAPGAEPPVRPTPAAPLSLPAEARLDPANP